MTWERRDRLGVVIAPVMMEDKFEVRWAGSAVQVVEVKRAGRSLILLGLFERS